MNATNLRCEYLTNPLGIDEMQPRLSWTLDSEARGQKQTAYRIVVASTIKGIEAKEGNLWDSGKIQSGESTHIVYSGKPLKTGMRCYWRVRVWDKDGKPSHWSDSASWTMGLLEQNAWQGAKWIGVGEPAEPDDNPLPAQMLRKEFNVDQPVRRATAYVSALGLYELWINGRRVGDHILAPEWTDYNRRIQYQTYDVTNLLNVGENAIGGHLGDGWYAGRIGLSHIVENGPLRCIYGSRPCLRVLIEIVGKSGKKQILLTDPTWRVTEDGPIRVSDILDGETYDARMEMDGWNLPGFDDSRWKAVAVKEDAQGQLVAQMNEPIRVIEEIKPIEVTEPTPGVYVFDLGQNMVGWCRIRVRGEAGQAIRLRHAEVLNDDGTIYRDNLRMPSDGGPLGARQEDTYICRSEQLETFEPHFTFHGFRYVEVVGLKEKPEKDFLVGRVFCSSFRETGDFECSSAMLNQLDRNILWGQRGNMLSVPTDCPQRDERLGWMGDAQVFAPAGCWQADMASFYSKFLKDVRDAQAEDGRFPDFAPHPFDPNARFSGVPAWGDAGVIVPWVLYEHYGDRRIIEENYESSKRWLEYIHKNNPDLIWRNGRGNDYGDWLNGDTLIAEGYPKSGGEVPKDVFGTLFFGYSTRLVARMAEVLGYQKEAQRYSKLADKIRRAFKKEFVGEDARIQGDTQAGYALALGFDMLPKGKRRKAVSHMVEAVENYKRHISTGFLSTIELMHELTRSGHNEIAYQLLNNKTFPSWGYSIEQGATTIWERWDGYVKGRGFQNPGMNSFNHYAFGAVSDWMWRNIIGIDTDGPGFQKMIIRPRPGGGLTWARGTYDSIRGPISVDWRKKDEGLAVDIVIPANTTATVYLPVKRGSDVTEGGKLASEAEGITLVRIEEACAVFDVESGQYRFDIR